METPAAKTAPDDDGLQTMAEKESWLRAHGVEIESAVGPGRCCARHVFSDAIQLMTRGFKPRVDDVARAIMACP